MMLSIFAGVMKFGSTTTVIAPADDGDDDQILAQDRALGSAISRTCAAGVVRGFRRIRCIGGVHCVAPLRGHASAALMISSAEALLGIEFTGNPTFENGQHPVAHVPGLPAVRKKSGLPPALPAISFIQHVDRMPSADVVPRVGSSMMKMRGSFSSQRPMMHFC